MGNGASYARASSCLGDATEIHANVVAGFQLRAGQGVLHPAIKTQHIIFDKTLGLAVCREVGKVLMVAPGSTDRFTIYTLGHIEDGLGHKEKEVLEQSTRENQSG